jgi:hypothetical protein
MASKCFVAWCHDATVVTTGDIVVRLALVQLRSIGAAVYLNEDSLMRRFERVEVLELN